jgi:hypothetical protein
MRTRRSYLLRLVVASVALAVLAIVPSVSAANNSEQVIFSKTGAFSESLGPLGFWIWCEAESANPYEGECMGSVYLYAFGTPRAVDGEITEPEDGIYVMDVESRDGFIDCTLTNTAEAVRGPNNTVRVDCTSPAVGTAFATGSIVNVTGPPEE